MNTTPMHPLLRIPPPLLFAATFLVGMGLQRLVPLNVRSTDMIEVSHVIGLVLLGCGVLLALSCVAVFIAVRTTIIPFGKPSNLIIKGAYRLSRNPMYLSLVLVYVGVAGALVQIWPLLLLLLPVTIVNRIVIPFEEARLQDTFGAAYAEYRTHVRRWL